MNFWITATVLLALAAVAITWPLITGSGRERVIALCLVLLMPFAGLLLYQQIGTPEALQQEPAAPQRAAADSANPHATQPDEMDRLLASLQQRMAQNPDDAEGWLILGRSLKAMKRYAEATEALANANRLLPNTPLIMVELAESTLFASGRPEIGGQTRQWIESALAIDPQQQKGLWLMGMALAQEGSGQQAITYWQRLLDQLEPASAAANSVSRQISEARSSLGAAPAVQAAPAAAPAASGIPVSVDIAADLAGSVPSHAMLFVFIHPAGTAGMPLAVKRIPAAQGFPMALQFTDADLIRPGASLQDFAQLDISARISMSGTANAAPGDYQASRITFNTKAAGNIALHIDQRIP